MPSDKRQRHREARAVREAAEAQAAQAQRRKRSGLVLVAAALSVVAIVFLITRDDAAKAKKDDAASTTTAVSTTAVPTTVPGAQTVGDCPPADGSAARKTSFPGPPATCIDPAKKYTARITTTRGAFTVELDAKAAPRTVNNFVVLARQHYYDGIVFHRVIPGFVVQGGDPDGNGTGGPGYQFADELPKAGAYRLGSLAMANSGPDTNGSQFFVITGDQGVALDPKYSLFGQVTAGMETVMAIEALGSPTGTPSELVKMESVTITEA